MPEPRRPDWIPKRQEFPVAVRKAVALRSAGMCEYPQCARPAKAFDHIVPDGLGGKATLDNCQHLCGPCHKRKTDLDKALIARADAAGGRTGQYARRERRKAAMKHKAIKSRGFAGSRKFNGEVKWKTK